MQEKKELECLILSDVLDMEQRFFLHQSLQKRLHVEKVLEAAKAVGPRAEKMSGG